ncbi:hypothetical protein Dimus_014461 [Dionaea muscipula]
MALLKWAFAHLISFNGDGENTTCTKEQDRVGEEEEEDGDKKLISPITTLIGAGDGERRGNFHMPVHYPRYKRADYESMEEWKVDWLLREYGLDHIKGTVEEKRNFAIGAFLWE